VYLEIEAKLKVDSLDEVTQRLAECGGPMASETIQTDIYFDTPDRKMTRTDQCIRLRCESDGTQERLILTYKGAVEADDFKKRQEINVEVKDADATEHLLGALGYVRALAFNKRRRTWQMAGCEVALDELPLLGAFVEIEGPDSGTIAGVQRTLGLTSRPHSSESYASQIAKELERLGLDRREVFL
jgi:adenylate cyclase class 2